MKRHVEYKKQNIRGRRLLVSYSPTQFRTTVKLNRDSITDVMAMCVVVMTSASKIAVQSDHSSEIRW